LYRKKIAQLQQATSVKRQKKEENFTSINWVNI